MTTVSQEAREARIARYLSDEKAARESLAAYPESTRQRLEAWQTEQSEWFSDTILEIVAEFITIDDAIRQSAERGEAWRPIEEAPRDEPILAALKVHHRNGDTWWERHVIVIDSETGTISDMDYHHGWEADDYQVWCTLPTPPEAL